MTRSVFVALVFVALAALFPFGADARRGNLPPGLPHQEAGKKCSLASLKGTYGYSYTGAVDGFGGVAAVGPIEFDGTGNTSATYSVNLGGTNFQGAFSGSYSVADDCTGSIVIDLPLLHVSSNGRFVIVDNGQEAFFMGTDPGVTVTGVATRQ